MLFIKRIIENSGNSKNSVENIEKILFFVLSFAIIVFLIFASQARIAAADTAADTPGLGCFISPDSLSFDEEPIEVGDPLPVIKVTFSKPAVDVKYALYNSRLEKIGIGIMNISSDKTVYRFVSNAQLAEGVYKFAVQAADSIGNCGQYKELNFRVKVQPIGVVLLNPLYDASNKRFVDLLIMTSRNSELCKFYSGDRMNFDEIQTPANIFTKIGPREHKLENFELTREGRSLNIVCNDSYGYINNDVPRTFFVYYDSTPPNIVSLAAIPSEVIEGNSVKIVVETDDETVCRFDNESRPYENMSFSFPAAAIPESLNFSVHDELIRYLTSDYRGTYIYYVGCMNRAQETSMVKDVKFSVNWDSPDKVLGAYPSGFVSSPDVLVGVISNRRANCYLNGAKLSTEDKLNHSRQLYLESEGVFSYNAECVFDASGRSANAAFSFKYDLSPPVLLFVNNTNPESTEANVSDPSCTCIKNILGQWDANDSLSGVVLYNFTVVDLETGELAVPWNITTYPFARLTGLNLLEEHTYGFRVRALNSAGLWNDWLEPPGFEYYGVVARSRCCSDLPVSCNDGFLNGNETDVDCGGTCDFKCSDDMSCIKDSDCLTNFCLNGKCSKPACENGVFDDSTGETDTDCGGPCAPCDADKTCLVSKDCKSLNCAEGVCAYPSCDDGVKNGEETNVDCGGSCPACKVPSCAFSDVCVANCVPMDDDCRLDVSANCDADGKCSLSCSPRDPDCPGYGPSCAKGDGCVSGCDISDPDCANAQDPCSAGNVCAVNCADKDPDCPVLVNPTCTQGDGCKQDCSPSDSDCDLINCESGNACVADCGVPDPDCDGKATCNANDGCAVGCEVFDSDCVPDSSANCGPDNKCRFNCKVHDPDCTGTVSCAAGNGCIAGCSPADPDCEDYFTCDSGDGCTLGCAASDSDCNIVKGHTCSEHDGCAPDCRPADIDCGGYTCNAGDACVLGCVVSDPDCSAALCNLNSECSSGTCTAGKCTQPSCDDSISNGFETGVDCGGVCSRCSDGSSCKTDFDCSSDYCKGDACTNFKQKDSDNDEMPDWWEEKYLGCNNGVCGVPSADPDKDGLTNVEEYNQKNASHPDGTDPKNKDTDEDGASDGVEVKAKTDPLDKTSKPSSPWLFIIIGIVVVLGLGFGAYVIATRKKPSPPKIVPPSLPQPQMPPAVAQQPRVPALTPEQRRQMELHQKFLSAMKEKQKKRLAMFSEFEYEKSKEPGKPGVGAAVSKKPSAKEWLEFGAKTPEKLEGKMEEEKKGIRAQPTTVSEAKDVFAKLAGIGKAKKPSGKISEVAEKLPGKKEKDVEKSLVSESESMKRLGELARPEKVAIKELAVEVKKHKESGEKKDIFKEMEHVSKKKK